MSPREALLSSVLYEALKETLSVMRWTVTRLDWNGQSHSELDGQIASVVDVLALAEAQQEQA